MKRKQLRQILDSIVLQYGNRTYNDWVSLGTDHVAESRETEFGEIQLEIQFLERSSEHVHIGFSVDDGGLWAYFPVSTSEIYERFPGSLKP